jgi:hypothetical protein
MLSPLPLNPWTSASNILYRRARCLRKATGNPAIMSAPEVAAASAALSPCVLAVDVLVRPFVLTRSPVRMLTHPHARSHAYTPSHMPARLNAMHACSHAHW